MDTENWLVGWREIGDYIGKSAKTVQRYGHDGMPFLRDPGGRPMAKRSHIDDFYRGTKLKSIRREGLEGQGHQNRACIRRR
jgi:hypothetical protein